MKPDAAPPLESCYCGDPAGTGCPRCRPEHPDNALVDGMLARARSKTFTPIASQQCDQCGALQPGAYGACEKCAAAELAPQPPSGTTPSPEKMTPDEAVALAASLPEPRESMMAACTTPSPSKQPKCNAVCRNISTGAVFTCSFDYGHQGDHRPLSDPSPEAMRAANEFFDSEESGGAVSHFARALDAFAGKTVREYIATTAPLYRASEERKIAKAVAAEREALRELVEQMAERERKHLCVPYECCIYCESVRTLERLEELIVSRARGTTGGGGK